VSRNGASSESKKKGRGLNPGLSITLV
jgi:hypothetical protein